MSLLTPFPAHVSVVDGMQLGLHTLAVQMPLETWSGVEALFGPHIPDVEVEIGHRGAMVDFQAIKDSLPEDDRDVIDQVRDQRMLQSRTVTAALTEALGCSEMLYLSSSASIKLCMHVLQLGKKLAAQRKQLSLHRHPLRTLYYFSACAASAAVRGCLWLAKHRITLTLLLPAIIGYVFLKQTGTRPV